MDKRTTQNIINSKLISVLNRMRCKICYSKLSNDAFIDINSFSGGKQCFQVDLKPKLSKYFSKYCFEVRMLLNERDFNNRIADIYREIVYIDNCNKKSANSTTTIEIQCKKCRIYTFIDINLDPFSSNRNYNS